LQAVGVKLRSIEKLVQHALTSSEFEREASSKRKSKSQALASEYKRLEIPLVDVESGSLEERLQKAQSLDQLLGSVANEIGELSKGANRLRIKIGDLQVTERVSLRKKELRELQEMIASTHISVDAPQLQKLLTKC